jgi:hypothetical protein
MNMFISKGCNWLKVEQMGSGPCTFRKRDLTTAVEAVVAAGVEIGRVEVDKAGTIVIIPKASETAKATGGEWDNI